MAKKAFNYFDAFADMCGYCVRAAKMLDEVVHNYNPLELDGKIVEMHDIEHSADIEKHKMMEALVREFLPPIEREDIGILAHNIDNLTDAIEDVVLRLYMFNIKTIRPEGLEFTEIITNCCYKVEQAVTEFKNFKKSTLLKDLLIEINTLEEQGDSLYTKSIRSLYTEENVSAKDALAWRETFQRFEKCCDTAEDIADTIESVIMKNN